MNIFKKISYRCIQQVFHLLIPILPYREPIVLSGGEDVTKVLEENKKKSILIVTDANLHKLGLTKDIESSLKGHHIKYTIYDKVQPNPTTDNVEEGLGIYKSKKCDAIIAIGGGSPMDCAKAIGARATNPKKSCNQMAGVMKVRHKIPLLIAVPTTAGTGSETTLAAVIVDSETRHKYAINAFHLIPKYAVLDYKYTLGLPKSVTAMTGMDALTHAVEAYIGRSTTRRTRKECLRAVELIRGNLVTAYNKPDSEIARISMLNASYLAGTAFTKSYVGYVHAIAHSLGGKYDIAHGYANAIILPYVLDAYGHKIDKKLYKLALAAHLVYKEEAHEVGAQDFKDWIRSLNEKLNIPTKIPEIKKEDIPGLAKTAEHEANPLYPVPLLWDNKDLEKIYYELID